MGLSFSPGTASWPYEGYAHFREQLAMWEGIDDLRAWWNNPFREDEQPTALAPLLDSSDVRGFISGPQCASMIPRLKAILKFHDMSHFDRSNLQALVKGMEHCAEHGCALAWG